MSTDQGKRPDPDPAERTRVDRRSRCLHIAGQRICKLQPLAERLGSTDEERTSPRVARGWLDRRGGRLP